MPEALARPGAPVAVPATAARPVRAAGGAVAAAPPRHARRAGCLAVVAAATAREPATLGQTPARVHAAAPGRAAAPMRVVVPERAVVPEYAMLAHQPLGGPPPEAASRSAPRQVTAASPEADRNPPVAPTLEANRRDARAGWVPKGVRSSRRAGPTPARDRCPTPLPWAPRAARRPCSGGRPTTWCPGLVAGHHDACPARARSCHRCHPRVDGLRCHRAR